MSELSKEQLDRVMRKIRHCLALSASSNEHEAAAALRQAKKLMQKHRLTETDIHLADVGKTSGAKVKAKRPVWDRRLSTVVAETFNCQTFTHSTYTKRGASITNRKASALFVGVNPAPIIAKYAYDALYVQVELARQGYLAAIRRGEVEPGRYSDTTRANDFADAWVSQVASKVRALVPEDDTPEARSDGQALIVVQAKENELITIYLNQLTNGEGVQKARSGKEREPNIEDIVNGVLAGRKAQVSPGIAAGADQVGIGQAPAGTQGSFL